MNRTARVLTGLFLASVAPLAADTGWPQYEDNPKVISLDVPAPEDSAGGLIAARVDGDDRPDLLVTVPGHVTARANDGSRLWTLEVPVRVGGQSESQGLPGHHGPGVQAGDIDGDGRPEVLFLGNDGLLRVVDGPTGEVRWSLRVPVPDGAERQEHAVIACLRGEGDRDLLLQATNREGYRMGRYVSAWSLDLLRERAGAGETVSFDDALWHRDDFLACAHNGVRVADLDRDGRDEVLGGTVLGPRGEVLHRIALRGHIDSIFARDVIPGAQGLEVVALEEGGGNRVFCFGTGSTHWVSDFRGQEPQNAGVGELAPGREGLEVWCRSRYSRHQKPFVFDARGEHVADYAMDDVAPEGWTDSGVEVIWSIHWTGDERELLCAKERHTEGDVAVFDGITGEFVERFEAQADRLYVADIAGDWREEIVVLQGSELRIWHNPAPNPRPERERLWKRPAYRRSKTTWNYYSP